MTTKYTPGPWKQHETDGKVFASVRGPHNETVADCGSRSDKTAQANARLIAAAPELVEALKECLAWFDLDPQRSHPIMAQDTEVGFRMIQQARAALTKAGAL